MKIKKIVIFIEIVLGLMLIFICGWLVYSNNRHENNWEIIPAEEISNNQLRQTVITLYFANKEKNELQPEARKIDAKKLIKNPYECIINLLIEGPQNENLIKIIPDGTEINNIEIKGNILYIDFTNEFINEQIHGEDQEKLIINSILKTMTELNEVNGIKILINGEEDKSFQDNQICFDNVFEI